MGLKLLGTDSRQTPALRALLSREAIAGLSYLVLCQHLLPLQQLGIQTSPQPEWLALLGSLCWVLMLVEFGFVLFHPAGRAIHDLVAGTVVLHHPHPLHPRRLPD